MTRLTERLSAAAAERVGFDAQVTRVVDVQRLDRMLRMSAAKAASAHPAVGAEDAAPASEVGARGPGRLR